MTPTGSFGSRFFHGVIALVISLCCGITSEAGPRHGSDAPSDRGTQAPASAPPETALGVTDRGIWSDLDGQVQLTLPQVSPERVSATVDRAHQVLVLSIDGFPRKVYPLGGPATLVLAAQAGANDRAQAGANDRAQDKAHDRAIDRAHDRVIELALRPGDRAELLPLLRPERVTERRAKNDRDQDGIPDPLDILIGARKTVLNAAAYTEGYVRIAYPMGDVPRTMGVCTDVVIRAVRNAGLDLQKALHDDIRRAPRAYPMVKGRGNPNIDHRRVATLLPYFKRHWERHSAHIDDPDDPLRPGDIVFLDTLARPGPDHVGIVSDRIGDSGLPLVINNWTNGTVTAEMDLLRFVPVLYRFRLPPDPS
jgi:uncharacterized protein YijF (DUF1287 family)